MKKYQKLISKLMSNDRNGTYDEILADADGDLIAAVVDLREILERLTDEILRVEDGVATEEYLWYAACLEECNDIL